MSGGEFRVVCGFFCFFWSLNNYVFSFFRLVDCDCGNVWGLMVGLINLLLTVCVFGAGLHIVYGFFGPQISVLWSLRLIDDGYNNNVSVLVLFAVDCMCI